MTDVPPPESPPPESPPPGELPTLPPLPKQPPMVGHWTPQRFPTWKQAFVIFGGSIVLSMTTCFSFLVSAEYADSNDVAMVLMFVFGILAIIGLLGIPTGIVLIIIRMVRALMTPPPERS